MIAAIIPACGQSRRMGRPKLTLPIAGRPLIARVVAALRDGGLDRVLVIAPPDSIEGAAQLRLKAANAGAEVITAPKPTDDMRATVEIGLQVLASGPKPPQAIALTPADSPGLSSTIVAAVLDRHREEPNAIVLPSHSGRRGHPLLLPWALALTIPDLPAGVGVNALLPRHESMIRLVPCDDPGALADLDTPEDYERWSDGKGA